MPSDVRRWFNWWPLCRHFILKDRNCPWCINREWHVTDTFQVRTTELTPEQHAKLDEYYRAAKLLRESGFRFARAVQIFAPNPDDPPAKIILEPLTLRGPHA